MPYNRFPAVDENNSFPPAIQTQLIKDIPKGDPGGWVSTNVTSGVNFDDYKTVGLYAFSINAAQASTNAPSRWGGSLEVIAYNAPNYLMQRYTDSRTQLIFMRTFSTAWGAWSSFAATRVSQTAGRAIYMFDVLNNREQLIYGHTGFRLMNGLLRTLTAGSVYIKLENNQVVVIFADAQFSDPVTNILYLPELSPNGFGCYPWESGMLATGQMVKTTVTNFRIYNHIPSNIYQGSLRYDTIQNWPTTLPGSPAGLIPNL